MPVSYTLRDCHSYYWVLLAMSGTGTIRTVSRFYFRPFYLKSILMKKGLLFSICIIVLSFVSCGPRLGTGNMVTEEREVGEFTAVSIEAPADAVIIVKPGAATTLKLKGFSDVLKELKVKIEDNTLHIYQDGDIVWNMDESTKLEITVGSLSGLALAGSSDVKVMGNITGDAFALAVAGAADVKIDEINIDKLSVEAAGAADINIKKGIARVAEYSFAGASDLKAYGVQSKEVSASIAGAGDIKVTVSETLSASISGMGDIHYKGKPSVSQDISGMGSVVDAN